MGTPSIGLPHISKESPSPSLAPQLLPTHYPNGVRRLLGLGPACPAHLTYTLGTWDPGFPASKAYGASFLDRPPMVACASIVYTLGPKTDQEVAVCRVYRWSLEIDASRGVCPRTFKALAVWNFEDCSLKPWSILAC